MDLRAAALVLGLAMLLSGCVSEPAPVAPDPPKERFDYQDDRFKIRGIDESAKDWVPTLQEPPQLTLGQWWKVRVYEHFTGTTEEAYRVVAGQEDDFWLIGMPTHDFSNGLMVLHIPGFGQIGKADLSFEAHDHWFHPIQFPVVKDDTWRTGFEGANNVQCTVNEVTDLTAEIECIGSYHITMTYDAALRDLRSLDIAGYGGYEVIEHGFAFHEDIPNLEGTVTVPHMSDLIFFHGRLGGAVQISPNGGPVLGFALNPVPLETIEVPSTYDRVSFSIILGDIIRLGPDRSPGHFELRATAPDGVTYESVLSPVDGAPLLIDSFKHDAPGGTWEVRYIAAGPGVSFIEGIGYHVYDVELPSGRILPSIGEHQHGSDDGH